MVQKNPKIESGGPFKKKLLKNDKTGKLKGPKAHGVFGSMKEYAAGKNKSKGK